MTNHKIAVHQRTFPIEWGDMDALGHVNNGRYFDYFQQSRIEWLESLHLDMKQQIGPVVIHVACTFLKPIVYPATLTLVSSVHSLGNSSIMMDHEIYQNEVLMTQGTSKIVWVNYIENKSVTIPDSIRSLFVQP
ncbi:acyl-CoA thioesterase [Legionella jamestowniensis]|uniref:Thiesterase n=2 Tax=Legionella jamestowniensis TaxID=455 RepID=A0A0W0UIY1_9GAMM|nr:thioesterase family protein [Legionella jamestowniensis]KTD07856.1 Thiesterase [Legionella jamestowniensis]OCH98994.1 thioesterase [Legionella jamestowniensis]SFL63214.1 acyl-CoA thioester hydrolase [Legionella jamestowniensis DSM 19215]